MIKKKQNKWRGIQSLGIGKVNTVEWCHVFQNSMESCIIHSCKSSLVQHKFCVFYWHIVTYTQLYPFRSLQFGEYGHMCTQKLIHSQKKSDQWLLYQGSCGNFKGHEQTCKGDSYAILIRVHVASV